MQTITGLSLSIAVILVVTNQLITNKALHDLATETEQLKKQVQQLRKQLRPGAQSRSEQ